MSGGIIASIVSFMTNGLYVLASGLSMWFPIGKGMTQFPIGYSTALVGAGYLVGITSGLAMLTGIFIAWAGFVPYFTISELPADGQSMQVLSTCSTDRCRCDGCCCCLDSDYSCKTCH